ncbi:MAG TPA: hypothetical protein VGI15_03600 [Candidatus Cybelea sp.]
MRAREQQRKPSVGQRACFALVDLVGEDQELVRYDVADLAMARAVDRPTTRHRHQPRFGTRGAAVLRPVRERRREGVGERVLGRGDVARAHRQQRDELAVAAPSDRLGNRTRGAVTVTGAAGRTHADGAS